MPSGFCDWRPIPGNASPPPPAEPQRARSTVAGFASPRPELWRPMDYDTAFEYLQRARNLGKERGLEMTVAVHDAAGHPVALARGKSRSWHGPYMAMGKARLAAAFGKPTSELVEQWKDRMLFPQSLIEIIPGGVTVNPGGCPIIQDGEVIGAIGVGGGSPDVDDAISRAAAGWTRVD